MLLQITELTFDSIVNLGYKGIYALTLYLLYKYSATKFKEEKEHRLKLELMFENEKKEHSEFRTKAFQKLLDYNEKTLHVLAENQKVINSQNELFLRVSRHIDQKLKKSQE